jgi:DNA-binding GntR family transcriptional regulator
VAGVNSESSLGPKNTKVEEIVLALEGAILSGELEPGAVLRQEQLSEEFAVSRTPIREALRALAALGLVTFEAHRGARVRSVSRAEIAETYLIRAELEGLAARLAAEHITPGQLAKLARAERRFAELTQLLRQAHDLDADAQALTSEWLMANDEFHDTLLEAAQAPLLAQMAASTRRLFHSHGLWWPSPTVERLYVANIEQHREILEALRLRDPKAGDLAKAHLLHARDLIDTLLQDADRAATSRTPGRSPSLIIRPRGRL